MTSGADRPTLSPARLRVLLLRDQPEQAIASMERFADELERGFGSSPAIELDATTVRSTGLARLPGPARRVDGLIARNIRYPLAVRGRVADVYHVVDQGYAHLVLALPRRRTVATCMDLVVLRADHGVPVGRNPLTRARYAWSTGFLRRVAVVACPSQATADDVHRFLGVPRDQIRVVPLGVGRPFEPRAKSEPRAVFGAVVGSGRVVLHVSNGLPYKNVPATLEVLAGLLHAGLDVTLARIGAQLTDDHRVLARRLGVESRIADLGRIDDEALIRAYNTADVLLFPSFWEGFGWPPLEAMACGLPVVASDCTPLRELIGEAGLLAPSDDIGGLTAAVRDVLGSPERAAALRRAGIERSAQFNHARTLAGYAEIYAQVAAAADDRRA